MQANTKCHLNIFRNAFWHWNWTKKLEINLCEIEGFSKQVFQVCAIPADKAVYVYKNNQKRERSLYFQEWEWPMGILVVWACRSDKPSPILGLNKTQQEETAWDTQLLSYPCTCSKYKEFFSMFLFVLLQKSKY